MRHNVGSIALAIGVVTKHDCIDAGAGRSSCRERLNKKSEIPDFIWLATYLSLINIDYAI